jgi:putative DNA primase/helicase
MDKLEIDAAKEDDPFIRNQLIKEIGELKDGMPAEILLPRLWTNDATPERLQMLLVEHGERMSVLSDEGVIFAIMGGLYNDGKANLDVFLKAHAGSPVRVDRASRSAHLDNPALTFGLAVQPQILSDFSQGGMRRFRGIGVLARFLYCLPRSNIGQRDVTRRDAVPSETMEAYRSGIAALLAIEPNVVGGREVPRTIKFHPQARRQWLAFSKYIEANQGPGKPFESIQDWTGKLPGAAARIAGLMHIVLHGSAAADIEIDASTMERALDLAHLLIHHAAAVFQLIGRDQCVADAQVIWDWLRRNPDKLQNRYVKRSDILRALHNRFPQVERLIKAMEWLQSANVVSGPQKLPTRKPTLIYHVNPKALEQ